MIWSRGHKNDWDYFAKEAGDPGWTYESILGIYRRIEDWQGNPDLQRRGKGGLVYVEPACDPNPMAPAMLESVRSLDIPTFDDQNGKMMEGEGGEAITNLRIRDGRRLSVFRTYTHPFMDRPNLTVLTAALEQWIGLGLKVPVPFRSEIGEPLSRFSYAWHVVGATRLDIGRGAFFHCGDHSFFDAGGVMVNVRGRRSPA
jgi:hypothetical protein